MVRLILIFCIVFCLKLTVIQAQNPNENRDLLNDSQYMLSREELGSHTDFYNRKIAGMQQAMAEDSAKLKAMVSLLKGKYPDGQARYYINQYPFAHPYKKYWTRRQEARVLLGDEGLAEILFIIEERNDRIGQNYQRTFIQDKTPHDGNYEDLVVQFKDYLTPQNSYQQKIADIEDLESKEMVLRQIQEYYYNLSRTIEADYYQFQQQKARTHKKMVGLDAD